MDGPFMPKYGTASQVLLQLVVANQLGAGNMIKTLSVLYFNYWVKKYMKRRLPQVKPFFFAQVFLFATT